MKKLNISLNRGYYWNKWVHKFFRLFRKIEQLKLTPDYSPYEKSRLESQLNSVYRRLSRMQSKVGIRIAGSAIALLMATSTLNAQSFENHGQIFSSPGTAITTLSNPSPEFADVDNDGDMDLYFGQSDGYIKVYKNEGGGDFVQAPNLQAGGVDIVIGTYSVPKFADIDGDSDLDLYVGGSSGNIAIFTNDGTGVFTAAGNVQAGGIDIMLSNYSSLAFADIDEDGDIDLFVGNYNYGTITKFTNDGTGVFTSAGLVQADGIDIDLTNYPNFTFSDLDEDGDLDLYVGERYNSHINVFLNNGSGVFTSSGLFQADGADLTISQYALPAFADIDEDGDLDLYVGDWYGGIHVFSNDGSGYFSAESDLEYVTPINFGYYTACTFADIDEDGDLDLYLGGQFGKVYQYQNTGDGSFVPLAFVQAGGVDIDLDDVSKPVFADLDEDGDLDLFVGTYNGIVAEFENNGGVFTSSGNMNADAAVIDVGRFAAPAFADLDNDNDLDLYVGEVNGVIKVFLNDGTGIFTSAPDFVAGGAAIDVSYTASPVFADMDYDGDLDLLVGEYFGSIMLYTNDGTGTFSAGVTLQSSGNNISNAYMAAPAVANLDNGCEPDLYVASYYGSVFHYNYADTTAPVITCPGNLEQTLFEGQPYWTVAGTSFDVTSLTDNCQIVSFENDYSFTSTLAGYTFPAGSETVVWTAVDADGNVSTCTTNVNIEIYNTIADLEELGVVVYPNPSSGVFTVENIEAYDLQISDMLGKVIRSYNNIPGPKLEIDLSDQDPGVYFITVTNDEESITSRIVIE